MKNQQKPSKQPKPTSLDHQIAYQQSKHTTAEVYYPNYTSYQPIHSNENYSNDYNAYYQGDSILNKPMKSPEILYNNEGQPVSTIEYIKSQRDIEHLDFINTLIRLKTGSSLTETTASNSNAQYRYDPPFPKEASIIGLNNDDSKSYIKEILDICGEFPNANEPISKKAKGLPRTDLIEITNRRKRMTDLPMNEPNVNLNAIKAIDTNDVPQEIQAKDIKDRPQGNTGITPLNDLNELHQPTNVKLAQIKPTARLPNDNVINTNTDAKSFNNIKNLKQIQDILKDTKKIESSMVNKKEKKSNGGGNRRSQMIAEDNLNLKPNVLFQERKDNRKERNASNTTSIQAQSNRHDSVKANSSLQNEKKDVQFDKDSKRELSKEHKTIQSKSKGKHKTSLSTTTKSNVTIAMNKDKAGTTSDRESIEIDSTDIKIHIDIGKVSEELKQDSFTQPQPQPQEEKEIEPFSNSDSIEPIVKAEINLFEDDIATESGTSKPRTSAVLSKLASSIQPITEKQIEFDIDELLHPKYLFKSANQSINHINSNAKSGSQAAKKQIQQRNSQSISSIEQPLSERTISKDITSKQPQLTKINTTKTLPPYNKREGTKKGDPIVLTTSPSKVTRKVAKTPNLGEMNMKKKKFKFEPRKSKENLSASDDCLIQIGTAFSKRDSKGNSTQTSENNSKKNHHL